MLKSYRNGIWALVYCQRHRKPDIFSQLKETNILVLSIEKEFISLRKQKDLVYLQNFKALHQSPDIEPKHLILVLKNENDLSQFTARNRSKRPSKCSRKALKNTLSAEQQAL